MKMPRKGVPGGVCLPAHLIFMETALRADDDPVWGPIFSQAENRQNFILCLSFGILCFAVLW